MSRGYEPLDCGFDRTSQDISLRNIPSASGYDSVSQLTEYEDGFENDSTSSLSPNASAVDPLTTVSALPKHIPHSSAPSLVAQEAPRRSQSTGPHPSDSAEQQQFQEIDPSPKQRSTLVSKYYQNWWFWELAGAILSAVCILAVVVLAYNINKTLLSAWKLPSSPSTMISTFITIAKTAMLLPVSEGLSQLKWLYFWINRSKHRPLGDIEAFEDASRGPWGSLLIFGRIGFQQGSPLALFGAFITIATLAMGPFAQQVISFKQENVPQPGINSTIPIARVYDTGIIPTRLSLNNRESTFELLRNALN
ncbi:hypothetical protein BFW01_g11846 [Lasiodiplodia theobromae]|nr:hypothetical protein BFW01_g11846 [Lasiodiplodia theobromae]